MSFAPYAPYNYAEADRFETPGLPDQEAPPIPEPSMEMEVDEDTYGRFVVEPLDAGHGTTLGSPMRRTLYRGLAGVAVTGVKPEEGRHGSDRTIGQLRLRLKGVRLRPSEAFTDFGDSVAVLSLEASGVGDVSAADIITPPDLEVVTPELHLATLTNGDAPLRVELQVGRGMGYREAAAISNLPEGFVPIDAVYAPVHRVEYSVDSLRVGHRTDMERLAIEVWTDGTMRPADALKRASGLITKHMLLLMTGVLGGPEEGTAGGNQALRTSISPESYLVTVQSLGVSHRAKNALLRAGYDNVGDVLSAGEKKLMGIRNFGDKSYRELFGALRAAGLAPEEPAT